MMIGMRMRLVLIAVLFGAARADVLKVGVFGDSSTETGPYKTLATLNGVYLAVADRGVKVQIVTSFAGCVADANNVSAEVTRLVKKEKVHAIIGPQCSPAVLGAAKTINALKVPAITPAAGAVAISDAGPYVWRTFPGTAYPFQAAILDLAKKNGVKKLAFIRDSSFVAADWVTVAINYWTKTAGGASAGLFVYDYTTYTEASLQAMVKQALATKPDAVYIMFSGYSDYIAPGVIVKALREGNVKFPLYMQSTPNDATLAKYFAVVKGGVTTYPTLVDIYTASEPPADKADARYKDAFGLNFLPPEWNYGNNANSYDAMSAIMTAAAKLGSKKLTGDAINKAMSDPKFTFLRFNGEMGSFDANGDLKSKMQPLKMVLNGSLVPVK